jgi:hypothetical protein
MRSLRLNQCLPFLSLKWLKRLTSFGRKDYTTQKDEDAASTKKKKKKIAKKDVAKLRANINLVNLKQTAIGRNTGL